MEVFGRDVETADVIERLRSRRLVTVVGPGGIGKTAVADLAAAQLATECSDDVVDVVRVDLTRVASDDGVVEAIAGQMGFADFESLATSPLDVATLMVIDNCEHVLDAAAAATERLLGARGALKVLATSRSPLEVPGESIITLASLPTPLPGFDDPTAPALQLLTARARDHGVELTESDRDAAAEVVRRLDGVPLAIEIAAARLRYSTVAGLLDELDSAPHALARRGFRGQANHRGVSEMVDSSYQLLRSDEQVAFSRLGVFAGPFTSNLGQVVTAIDPGEWPAVLDGLIAASLVVVERGSKSPRYRLLHPVRAVARELLVRSGDEAMTHSRLVDAITERVVDVARGGADGWRESSLQELLELYDDSAASIRWALQHDEADPALVLVAAMWGVVHNAHAAEIGTLGEQVLARWPDPAHRWWPNAAATVATCRFLRGELDGAIALAQLALDHAWESSAVPVLLNRVLAQSRRAAGDAAGALATFRTAATLAEERGAHGLAMELWVDVGLATVECGDVAAGLHLVQQATDEATERGATINRLWGRAAHASILLRSERAAATRAIDSIAAETRAAGYPAGIAFGLRSLAGAHLLGGNVVAAARTSLELLDGLLRRGGLDEMRVVLDIVSEIARRADDPSWSDLVATANTLPVTSFATPVELDYVPSDQSGRILTRREAFLACRSILIPIAAGEGAVDATDDDRVPEGQPDPADRAANGHGVDPTVGDARTTHAEMVAEGDVWHITFAGNSFRIRSSKGVQDLAVLLARPGREVSAADLAGVTTVGGTEDELLDSEARHNYEQRIRDLQVEIDEADADNDLARAERARVELDMIVDQLSAALGLGGRSRRTTGTADRARSAVTQRIRSAIRRIDDMNPDLGAHLRAFVSTGLYCCYEARSGITWSVRR